MDEFDLIRTWFAPLATSPGADGLRDDVAEIDTPGRTILSADAIVEGVHFLPDDPLETVGAKLVRVNVSDILAKGGRPGAAMLSLVWPKGRPAGQLEDLARGLRKSLDKWEAHLAGGDTTSTAGPLVLSLTLTGSCGERGPVRRSGAQPGDEVWVTGAIGDGWLGLQAATGALGSLSQEAKSLLVSRYRVPEPPKLKFAKVVAASATASIDVSDGLAADAGHVAEASGTAVLIEAALVPLSSVGAAYVANGRASLADLLTGGDDYQTLFCARPEAHDAILADCTAAGIAVTRIGRVEAGKGATVMGPDGAPMSLDKAGWRHFAR